MLNVSNGMARTLLSHPTGSPPVWQRAASSRASTRLFSPPHRHVWLTTYPRILKTGGVVVPIDKELKEIELGHVLAHSEARPLFVDGDQLDKVLGMANGLPQQP